MPDANLNTGFGFEVQVDCAVETFLVGSTEIDVFRPFDPRQEDHVTLNRRTVVEDQRQHQEDDDQREKAKRQKRLQRPVIKGLYKGLKSSFITYRP